MINFYKKFIAKGDLCFDIGANIGERTEIFLKLGAKVIAIEPQQSCANVLENKFGDNKNIKLVKCAVGRSEREGEIMICNETNECSTLFKDFVSTYSNITGFHWDTIERVRVITLENLFNLYGVPKFCKVDVEGYESEVFLGMKRKAKYVAFEFNKPLLKDTIESLKILSEIGKCR